MEEATSSCFNCKLPVLPVFYFCPNCGKQLRQKPISVSILKQIGVYLLSFFFPPIGFRVGFKYLKQNNAKTKVVGWVAMMLSVASTCVSIYFFSSFMQKYSQIFDQISSGQFSGY